MIGPSAQVLVLLKLTEAENVPGLFGVVISGLTPLFLARRSDFLLVVPVSSSSAGCEFPAVRTRV
jgi:hypothetical protein